MILFVIQILITALLAFLVYLVSLTLPRISDEEIEELKVKKNEKLMVFIEKSDTLFKYLAEKVLRKTKVWLLMLNNLIENKLNKFKKNSNGRLNLTQKEEDN